MSGNPKFTYIKVPEENETAIRFGFELSFFTSNTGLLGIRTAKRYVYRPSQKYDSTEYRITIHEHSG